MRLVKEDGFSYKSDSVPYRVVKLWLRKLVTYFAGDSVRSADLVAPVSTSDRDDRQLGQDDGSPDSGGDFFAALDSQSHVSGRVADGNDRLESCSLTGTCLLLDGHDLEDLVLQSRSQKVINDL